MTVLVKHITNVESKIANVGGIAAGDLSLSLTPGHGALLPALTGGAYMYAIAVNGSAQWEIMKVTAVATDALTITRAQGGTTARTFAQNDVIYFPSTHTGLNDIIAGITAIEALIGVSGAGGIVTIDATQHLTGKTVAGTWSLVGSWDIANLETNETFAVTTAGIYRLEYCIRTNSTYSYPQIRFNGDADTNYKFTAKGYGLAVGVPGEVENYSYALGFIPLSLLAAFQHKGTVEFSQGYATTIMVTYKVFSYLSNDNMYHLRGGGYYNGSAAMSSITFMINAQSFAGGWVRLFQLV